MEIIESGYTRVSEILQIFQAYAFVDRKKLKKRQDDGTAVHDAIEAYFRGNFSALDDKRDGYFLSFLKFLENTHVKPLYIEQRLYDDQLMITGRVDLVAEIDGMDVIVDWKTGSWAHPEIWNLQGCFYRDLIEAEWLENDGNEMPNHFLFVQLSKDGNAPLLYPMKYDPDDWEVCMAAIRCYRYFNKKPLISEGLTNNKEDQMKNTEIKDTPILSGEGK